MKLPVHPHPTLTVLIDDSDSFLKSLAFQLDPALARKTLHDTSAALHWLRHGMQQGETPLHVNFDTQNLPPDQCNVAHQRPAPALCHAVGTGGRLLDAADEWPGMLPGGARSAVQEDFIYGRGR